MQACASPETFSSLFAQWHLYDLHIQVRVHDKATLVHHMCTQELTGTTIFYCKRSKMIDQLLQPPCIIITATTSTTTTTTVLRPFFRDHPGEPVPEEKLLGFTVQGEIYRGRHTDHPAGRHSIRTNQCLPPQSPIFTGQKPFLPPNQQCQSTEGN